MNNDTFKYACALKHEIEKIERKQRNLEDVRSAFSECLISAKPPASSFEKVFMEEIRNLDILDDIVEVLKEQYDNDIKELEAKFEEL